MVHLTVICLFGIMFCSSLPTRKASMFRSSNISMEYKQVKECGLRLSSPPPRFKNTSMHGIIVIISICLGPFSRTYQAKGPSIGSLNQHFGRETLGFSTYLVSLPPFFFLIHRQMFRKAVQFRFLLRELLEPIAFRIPAHLSVVS